MKRRWILWILLLSVFLTACTGNKSGEPQTAGIRDALQIRTYAYHRETNSYTPTTLELNEPIILRMGGSGMNNLNLQFCFEGGVCEVTSDDEDIQLSIGTDGSYWAENSKNSGVPLCIMHKDTPVSLFKHSFDIGAVESDAVGRFQSRRPRKLGFSRKIQS